MKFGSSGGEEMSLFQHIVILLGLCFLGEAFVDTYVYHYDDIKSTKDDLANFAALYYDQRDELLTGYTGHQAEDCKSKLAKERWYALQRIALQNIMIQLVGQIKTVDTDRYNAAQACGEDCSCNESTHLQYTSKLADFKSSAESSIDKIKQDYLAQIRDYMDTCIQNQITNTAGSLSTAGNNV